MSVTIGGIPVDDLPDLGAVADSSEIVAEQSGTGVYRASALKTYTNAGMATQAALDAETAARIAADSAAAVRTVQGAAAVVIYVNNVTGNDANTGLSSAQSLRTIAKARDVVCDKWISSNAGIKILLAASGTAYNEATLLRPYAGAGGVNPATVPTIEGATSAVTISPASGNCFTVVGTAQPWVIKGLTLAAPNGYGIIADWGSIVYHQGCNFGACPNGSHMVAEWDAILEALVGPYTISGGAQAHVAASRGGKYVCQGNVITITGSPTFSVGFVTGTDRSIVDFSQASFVGTVAPSRNIVTDGTAQIVGPTAVLNGGFPGGSPLLQAMNNNVDLRAQAGDANYSIQPYDRFVVNASANLTAPRTWTLPPAASVAPGQVIWLMDYMGINGANTITVSRQGPDVISGGASFFVMSTKGQAAAVMSAGAGGWYRLV